MFTMYLKGNQQKLLCFRNLQYFTYRHIGYNIQFYHIIEFLIFKSWGYVHSVVLLQIFLIFERGCVQLGTFLIDSEANLQKDLSRRTCKLVLLELKPNDHLLYRRCAFYEKSVIVPYVFFDDGRMDLAMHTKFELYSVLNYWLPRQIRDKWRDPFATLNYCMHGPIRDKWRTHLWYSIIDYLSYERQVTWAIRHSQLTLGTSWFISWLTGSSFWKRYI